MISVHWSELWHQGFIWKDVFRCNYRCLFGAAHMVGFFQRVSLSIKTRGDKDMQAYDAMLPLPSPRRRASCSARRVSGTPTASS
eukprot:1585042-Prymnesium_polylepis.1